MSWTTEAKAILSLASTGLTGLEMIGDIIEPFLTGEAAQLDAKVLGVLRTVHAIVSTIRNGSDGRVNADEALALLKSKLGDNDHQVQLEIDAKFPPA